MGTITSYIAAAMRRAEVKETDDGRYLGKIADCQGVRACESTRQDCLRVLKENLEEWVVFVLVMHGLSTLPIIDGVTIEIS